jgi:hypothetical protein
MEKQALITEQPAQKPPGGSRPEKHSLKKRRRKRDRSGENFRKRWKTLVKTGNALHQNYGARIYLSISLPKTRRDFVFRSDEDVLPLMPGDLVWICPLQCITVQ